jgi:hypothetical protein
VFEQSREKFFDDDERPEADFGGAAHSLVDDSRR